MTWNCDSMNNTDVETILNDCLADLVNVEVIINRSSLSPNARYLTNYALIKACSTIERCFKKIIADRIENLASIMSYYVNKEVRESSANPSYDKMLDFLAKYNPSWKNNFKARVKGHADARRIKSSLESLVNNRNTFAHTGSCACSFADVSNFYVDAVEFINILDDVVMFP